MKRVAGSAGGAVRLAGRGRGPVPGMGRGRRGWRPACGRRERFAAVLLLRDGRGASQGRAGGTWIGEAEGVWGFGWVWPTEQCPGIDPRRRNPFPQWATYDVARQRSYLPSGEVQSPSLAARANRGGDIGEVDQIQIAKANKPLEMERIGVQGNIVLRGGWAWHCLWRAVERAQWSGG